jgi:hypothetical protein
LHVLLVGADGGVDAHAGGAAVADVGFVEGHESGGAGVDGRFGGGGPGIQ